MRLTALLIATVLGASACAGASPLISEDCHPIHADRIYARDLATAVPSLAGLPPDLEIGFAPVPGAVRVFRPSELRHMAAAYQLTTDVNKNVCFAWELAIPTREEVQAAMRKTLADLNPQIEILEQSRAAAPRGDACFPLSGLSAISDKPVVWKGYIAYAGKLRFSTWALVQIRIRVSRVVALDNLQAGDQLTAAQLRLESYEGPPTRDAVLTQIAQAVGLVTRCNVRAGTPIFAGMLDAPQEVKRGDLVVVVAENGAAHIQTQGIAQQPGRLGDVISIRNPKSGKAFRARVQAHGSVLVIPGTSAGLVGEEQKS